MLGAAHREREGPLERDLESVEAFVGLMARGVVEAMRRQDFERLLSWVGREAPRALASEFGEASSEKAQRTASLALATAIWDVTPLPGNGFRPRPRPRPGRNEPCLCGSGRKFKRCCGDELADVPVLPAEELWDLVAPDLRDSEIRRFLEDPVLPPEGLAPLGHQAAERGHESLALTSLARCFDGSRPVDERHAPALELYLELVADQRGEALGEFRDWALELGRRLPEVLRASVMIHLVPVAVAMGDFGRARAFFEQATRDAPDHPALGPSEVLLLLYEGELDVASSRARFHLARMRRRGLEEDMPDAIEMLEAVVADPSSARDRISAGNPQPLLEAQRLASEAAARPARPYAIEGDETGYVLTTPPKGVDWAEKAWRKIWPVCKPDLTGLVADLPPGLVEDPEPWATVLARHPEAFDSLDVLDDLALLAFLMANEEIPGALETFLMPLGERARAIVRASLGDRSDAQLPWGFLENRPALRTLSLLGYGLDDAGRPDAARVVYEEILALNPTDNHGHRGWLINHYLQTGADARALEITESYPGDFDVAVQFGRSLALWRLGQRDRAEPALRKAAARRPEVVRYLLAKRPKRPPIDPDGFSIIGGKDEAWIYRQEMRSAWQATPSALAFLKSLPRSRRR
jgi:tetratricopeptide (TPR) repeat protein